VLSVEALVLLIWARASLWMLPFATCRRTLARLCPLVRRPAHDDSDALATIASAVRRAARCLPGTTCLVEAVAAEAMLRRRGYPATLKFGVRPPVAGARLDAHAWTECGGIVVVGGGVDLDEYAVFAEPR
jgi:Transglutaminase-like superfamily